MSLYLDSPGRSVCQTCHHLFSRPSSLMIHTFIRILEKPHKCNFEGDAKDFGTQSKLKDHQEEDYPKKQCVDVEKDSDSSLAIIDEEGLACSSICPSTGLDKTGNNIKELGADVANPNGPATSNNPGPPPDGGWVAWMQVIMAHIIIFNTWGYINSFGVFQVYLAQHLDRSPSDISWVGSTQIFLLFSIGLVSGRATDAGLFKLTFAGGWALQLLALFMTSLCKTYWQLFLAQGLCTGLGNGLVFCPSLAIITTYFTKHRALAVGIAGCGGATGGVIYPLIAQKLLPSIGYGWTLRVMGFLSLGTMIFPLFLMRTRLPPRKTGPLIELSAFQEVPYLLFAIGNSLCFLGLYFTIYYISAYGVYAFYVTEYRSITILIILNAAGIPGRLLPNYIADRYLGPLNTMIPLTFVTSVLIFTWIVVASPYSRLAGYEVFAAFYGAFASGVLSVFPSVCASLTPPDKMDKAGIRLGMVMTCISLSVLIGPPIGGALLQADGGSYLGAQVFFGCVTMLAMGFLIALRFVRIGPKLLARI